MKVPHYEEDRVTADTASFRNLMSLLTSQTRSSILKKEEMFKYQISYLS